MEVLTTIKELPILFSTAMVQAILRGDKTQTRRVVKPQPLHFESAVPMPCPVMEFGKHVKELAKRKLVDIHTTGAAKGYIVPACPYGQPGARLWVRETFQDACDLLGNSGFVYKADNPVGDWEGTWKPSIHMPRAACRMELEITGTRVERLQDISEEDAKAEGVSFDPNCGWSLDNGKTKSGMFKNYQSGYHAHLLAITSFRSLWQSINGPASWSANPWVWVVEFKVVEGGVKGE